MPTVYGNPFRINWKDKDAVIAYANRLGKGQTVFQDQGRDTFGIVHSSRKDRLSLEGRTIVHQT